MRSCVILFLVWTVVGFVNISGTSLGELFSKLAEKRRTSDLKSLTDAQLVNNPAKLTTAVDTFGEAYKSDNSSTLFTDGNGKLIYRQLRRLKLNILDRIMHPGGFSSYQ
ncbi:unnamed protein product [Caenorhabditis auriculariae]|uniref:Uncharacterized protein n=1 Tax=Caenorhabditis auriculariae TaxID=2777116 RepID=A0A8S1HLH2_9PELO|nr:unnamed protein product [Caenorhabditis auriculariae]